jgi:predicted nucleic acid-binding protein
LGVEGLRACLQRHRRIALDTSIFLYQLEANERYLELSDTIFVWLERPESSAVTSTITITELLVQAYREGDEQRADQFYGLLSTYPNLDWLAPNLEIADAAARLRALYRIRTPDAIQAATAAYAKASALVTNDKVFKRVEGLDILLMDAVL